MRTPSEVLLWITPKIFDDLCRPAAAVGAFFDHYRDWFSGRRVTIVFAAGNGDHVLNYAGKGAWLDRFDWARYNAYAPGPEPDRHRREHNRGWLERVREGGEHSGDPYAAGPMMILSEQAMDYEVLAGIYATVRAEATTRGIEIRLLEYLEPGLERCASEWKSRRHPEVVTGAIDVTLPLEADRLAYAAFPDGIPAGLAAGSFTAAQTAAFCEDFALDGVLLGDRFLRPQGGIEQFFTELRERMGDKLIYWTDTGLPADVEREARGMSDAAYGTIDAILASSPAAEPEGAQLVANLRSKAAFRRPRVLLGLDFVDPWRWHRAYLDDRRTYVYQREVLAQQQESIDGVSFFANDTFGHFIAPRRLRETLAVLREGEPPPPHLE